MARVGIILDLLCAAKTGNFQEVKQLVEDGADVNCKNYHFGSPLHSGALSGSLEIIKYLVEHGADVNCKNYHFGSPLHSGASSVSLEIIKYLVEHGADVNCENDCLGSPLHCAGSSGSLEIVKYLVEHGADVTNEEGALCTVLFLACEAGNASIVDYLLQYGAMKDMDNWKLKSPLRIACQKGHTSVVQTLMKYEVDIRKEKEPLICGNNEIINILNVGLKKSLKHRKKIQILKEMDNVNLTEVRPPLKYFTPKKSLMLGRGSMGTSVYVGIMEDGAEVAVKRILNQVFDHGAEADLEILTRIDASKSPFIVSYRTFLKDATFVYLVFDLCEETLREHVHTQRLEYLQDHGPRMIKEILSGIEFLHSRNILHRGLKPSNVLVDVEGHMRLAGFGISRVLNEEETTVLTNVRGTGGWMAAEVIEAINKGEIGRFKKKSDVQVAGMIAFFISTKGEHPFGLAVFERMVNISEGHPVNLEMLHDLQVRQFISWLISHNIDDRPYAAEALTHPFMVHVVGSLAKISCMLYVDSKEINAQDVDLKNTTPSPMKKQAEAVKRRANKLNAEAKKRPRLQETSEGPQRPSVGEASNKPTPSYRSQHPHSEGVPLSRSEVRTKMYVVCTLCLQNNEIDSFFLKNLHIVPCTVR